MILVIIEYDGRRSELPNTPLYIKHKNNITTTSNHEQFNLIITYNENAASPAPATSTPYPSSTPDKK